MARHCDTSGEQTLLNLLQGDRQPPAWAVHALIQSLMERIDCLQQRVDKLQAAADGN